MDNRLQLDNQQNYFDLFGLRPDFAVDIPGLAVRYRALLQQVHPDRFAAGDDREKRIAVQQAALVNSAYSCLKSPLARAQYLLELEGVVPTRETAIMAPEFLMQQIEWREQIEALAGQADIQGCIDNLYKKTGSAMRDAEACFVESYQSRQWEAAQDAVNRMQFLAKIEAELHSKEEQLLDE